MAAEAQSDIADILGQMASGPIIGERSKKFEIILRHFSKVGMSIKTAGDFRHLDRATSTLKRYARRWDLKFSDYVPMHLRPKKAKAAKRRRTDAH